MDVLRHDHVADQAEGVPCADFVQDLGETVAGFNGVQQWSASNTTERDEVKVALPVSAD
jgi:hypothetical protein